MPGRITLMLVIAFLLPGYAGHVFAGGPGETIPAAYKKADAYFNSNNPTDKTDSLALHGFTDIIRLLAASRGKQYDTLLFQSYLKQGILLDVKNDNPAAKQAYLEAVAVQRNNTALSDSLLFRPYIYVGSNYFNLNNFDSASYYLVKAEALVKHYPHLPETERLYNTLGALHFVNGNYLQSKNYFSQALTFISNRQPYDRVFALGLKANMASSYYKLGDYTSALDIYRQIIKEKKPASYIYNGILMNMGKAYAAIKKYPEALACYKKIPATEMPGVLNELAICYYENKSTDSAIYFLDHLKDLNRNNTVNVLDIGINDLYRATILSDQQRYMQALAKLQHVITLFAGNFRNTDIYSNPIVFSGSYTYYRLFDALYKKAQTFALLYKVNHTEHYLQASLDAYTAVLNLLGFIEKSYDTDDAKLFLKKKSEDVYEAALMIALQLHQIHPGGKYLEQAFMISEKNKASVMTANLRQKSIASVTGIDQSLLQTERNIKFAIARLDIKSEKALNNASIQKLTAEKAVYEIQLSQLQKKMEQNNHFFQLKYDDDFHSIAELQKSITGSQVVFSFYFGKAALHVFAVTETTFQYAKIDSTASLHHETEEWIQLLRLAGDGRKFKNDALGQHLYTHLVKPLQSIAPGKEEWTIIPDGNLYLFPFESLPDGNTGKLLVETTTISYQFSTRFLMNAHTTDKSTDAVENILSFAPFIKQGAGYQQAGYDFIGQLPASGEEIAALKGSSYTNSRATKTNFLQQAGRYPIIHLATHAIGDAQNAAASFIAFYPEKESPAENCLYLEEIYGMNLDNCKLTIISACETGKGKVIDNEGVMSLGRAFAYAGCGATVNSLWKADDKATAFILEKFHVYLAKGDTKAKALQKAKLDYINSDALYTSPAYWSNLVLTGDIHPVYKKTHSAEWVIAIVTAFIITAAFVLPGKKEKKVDAFHNYFRTIIAKS